MKLIVVDQGEKHLIDVKDDIVNNFEKSCSHFISTEVYNYATITVDDKQVKTKHKDSLRLYVGFNDGVTNRRFDGVVNTLNVHQGTHQRLIEMYVKNYLFLKAERSKMHILKDDVLIGARFLAVLKLTDPQFSGQTKYALDMSTSKIEHIINQKTIDRCLDNNQEFVREWLDYAQMHRIKLDSKRKMNGKRKSRNIVVVDGLKDCTSDNVDERELFILEGQSAGGTLQQARDVKKHAVLPLRGKILNVLNSQPGKIMDNKVIMNIFTSLNVRPFSSGEESLNNLRYGKVIIMCDADYDGLHIAALLLSMFDKCAPKLIDEGRLYVAETPLYGCYVKKKFIPIYDEEMLQEMRDNNAVIYRYKGLGEMEPKELATCVLNDNTRRLINVERPSKDDEQLTLQDIWKNKQTIISDYLEV